METVDRVAMCAALFPVLLREEGRPAGIGSATSSLRPPRAMPSRPTSTKNEPINGIVPQTQSTWSAKLSPRRPRRHSSRPSTPKPRASSPPIVDARPHPRGPTDSGSRRSTSSTVRPPRATSAGPGGWLGGLCGYRRRRRGPPGGRPAGMAIVVPARPAHRNPGDRVSRCGLREGHGGQPGELDQPGWGVWPGTARTWRDRGHSRRCHSWVTTCACGSGADATWPPNQGWRCSTGSDSRTG